jgi:hypothetical protein
MLDRPSAQARSMLRDTPDGAFLIREGGDPDRSVSVRLFASVFLSLSLSLSLSHTHTHTHTLSLSLSHTHTHTRTLAHTHTHTHTHSLSLSLSLTHTLSHTLSPFLSHVLSPILSPCLSRCSCILSYRYRGKTRDEEIGVVQQPRGVFLRKTPKKLFRNFAELVVSAPTMQLLFFALLFALRCC